MSASLRDRAATPSEPSQEVVSGKAGIPSAAWLPIKIAPRDGTPIFGRTFDGFTLVAHYEHDGFVDEDGKDVGGWVAEYEDEHPDDWTDGACWSSNESGNPSDPLVGCISLSGIAHEVAEACVYKPGTDNYARVYQGALHAAKRFARSIASAIEARSDAAPQSDAAVGESATAASGDAQTTAGPSHD